MFLRPDEGPAPSNGWLICAGEPSEVRETIILLLNQLQIGAPIPCGWLWDLMVPVYGTRPALTIYPQAVPVLQAALVSLRTSPMLMDRNEVLETMDSLVAHLHLSRTPTPNGWAYVNEAGTSVLSLDRSTCFTINKLD